MYKDKNLTMNHHSGKVPMHVILTLEKLVNSYLELWMSISYDIKFDKSKVTGVFVNYN